MIKKNEQVANEFIQNYSNYGQTIIELKKTYSPTDYLIQKSLEARKNKISSSEADLDSIMSEYYEIQKIREEKIKDEEEKMKSEKEQLERILNQFTQEMLVFIYGHVNNPILKDEIKAKIFNNNYHIHYLNTLACESGAIFQDLELNSKKELIRIASLRETTDDISFEGIFSNNSILQKLNNNVLQMIVKVLNGESLEQEKNEFFKQHNLSNEIEFQFYKTSVQNQNLLDVAKDTQRAVNEFFHIDNDDLVNAAYNNMSSIRININRKK